MRWPKATRWSPRMSARSFETDDVAVALNTALMGDGAVIHVAAGTVLDAADPSGVRAPARRRLGLHPLADRGGEGRAGHVLPKAMRPNGEHQVNIARSSW